MPPTGVWPNPKPYMANIATRSRNGGPPGGDLAVRSEGLAGRLEHQPALERRADDHQDGGHLEQPRRSRTRCAADVQLESHRRQLHRGPLPPGVQCNPELGWPQDLRQNGPMRIFAAVVPSQPALDDLAEFLDPRRDAGPDLRWTDPSLWHVTAAFMADVPARLVDPMVDGVAEAVASRTPIPLRLKGGGAFPNPYEARVTWMGVDGEPESLDGAGRAGPRRPTGLQPRGRQPRGRAVHAPPHGGPLAPPLRGDSVAAGARRVCRSDLDRRRGHRLRLAPWRGQGATALRTHRRGRALRLTRHTDERHRVFGSRKRHRIFGHGPENRPPSVAARRGQAGRPRQDSNLRPRD